MSDPWMDTVKRLRELYDPRLGNTGALLFYAKVVNVLPALLDEREKLLDVVEAARRYSYVTLIPLDGSGQIATPSCSEHAALIDAIARLEEK